MADDTDLDECLRDSGYWKTHSEHGPGPYDDTWAQLPDGADTEFYLSGQSYYDVLWTPPKRGNAYYILAHKFIAAEMNVRAGADIPVEVEMAWDDSAVLFDTFVPAEVGQLRGGERHDWLVLAEILADYNAGEIGPGSCDGDDDDDVDVDDPIDDIVDVEVPEYDDELLPTPGANTHECTLGYGYWKTHSEHGPAPYDDTWAQLPDGADTEFYLSGQSYYDVLWTPPKGGNAYYILAHSFIASELNVLAGVELSEDVESAWVEAADMFALYVPEKVGELKGKERKPWLNLATALSRYNNGIVGPGNCNDLNYDGGVDAVDVQIVVNSALKGDPFVGAPKIQFVINSALGIY